MKTFFNMIHGLFLGFVLGMTLAVVVNEYVPDVEAYFHPAYIIPSLAAIGAIIGFIKGYNHHGRFLFPIFSTVGTIIIPILSLTALLIILGYDRALTLPPVLFKTGFGLSQMDTQLSTYILSIFLTLSAVAALISSFSINKRKRWTW
ncbi:hypothetical protein [Alkaliphilus hydrothermalis]|uniref:Small basic protein n=1 Tax=Alkaliphilus hydrothermalis TaxID=1482730 RepID=A0ABS2NM52_9FIRM|nr:hypothetical protein [Alkaliphilus hydrothermalis]MBM7613956.1 small basic protein [Alkaliphilus hydrothermalis]